MFDNFWEMVLHVQKAPSVYDIHYLSLHVQLSSSAVPISLYRLAGLPGHWIKISVLHSFPPPSVHQAVHTIERVQAPSMAISTRLNPFAANEL